MAKKKEYRSLKISSIWNYGSNPSPQLRLQGRWLEELGFQIGEAVLVKCEDGKLIITPDTMRAETESREKEFLDREMALLQRRRAGRRNSLIERWLCSRRDLTLRSRRSGSRLWQRGRLCMWRKEGDRLCLMQMNWLLWTQTILPSSTRTSTM